MSERSPVFRFLGVLACFGMIGAAIAGIAHMTAPERDPDFDPITAIIMIENEQGMFRDPLSETCREFKVLASGFDHYEPLIRQRLTEPHTSRGWAIAFAAVREQGEAGVYYLLHQIKTADPITRASLVRVVSNSMLYGSEFYMHPAIVRELVNIERENNMAGRWAFSGLSSRSLVKHSAKDRAAAFEEEGKDPITDRDLFPDYSFLE